MTIQYRTVPTYGVDITTDENTSSVWYRWFQDIDKGTPPAPEAAVVVTASPYTYTAVQKGFVIVTGGTVSLIRFSRVSGTAYATGQTAGIFPLSFGDMLTITYTVIPTVTFVPQ